MRYVCEFKGTIKIITANTLSRANDIIVAHIGREYGYGLEIEIKISPILGDKELDVIDEVREAVNNFEQGNESLSVAAGRVVAHSSILTKMLEIL